MDNDRELQRFIRGERRELGWESDWLKEFKRRSAMESKQPAKPVAQVLTIHQILRSAPQREKFYCTGCKAEISRMSKSGCCRKCSPRPRLYVRKGCIFCGQELRRVNKTQRCIKHKYAKEAA